MKKIFLLLVCLFVLLGKVQAADLVEVYRQALICDPTFQQTIAQTYSTEEGVPISISALLPNIVFNAKPYITRTSFAGSAFAVQPITRIALTPRNNTIRGYQMYLTATQTVFNFAQFAAVTTQVAASRQADAQLNYALQDLMVRVTKAYLAILQDEDNLSFNEANKLAYSQQLDQVKQQYDVGLRTITDVYTAQASYDSAVANYIAAQTALYNDRENLRVITGKYYGHIAFLSDDFPLVTPQPADIETWVKISLCQNWSIKASQYGLDSKRHIVKQQFAGHLPTINVQGTLDRLYVDNINGYNALINRNGPGMQVDRQIAVNFYFPVFQGGLVTAQTNQAVYNYQAAQQSLEYTIRSTVNVTRQSYMGIIAGISQINADKQAIKSNISSLEGMEASYRVGTTTLVDVLNQQQKLFQAQTKYATDRYTFVNNIFQLKQAAGTLNFDDICALNGWLTDEPQSRALKRSFLYNGTPGNNKNVKHVVAKKITRKQKA